MRELAWVNAFPQMRHWHGFSPGEAAGGLSPTGINVEPPLSPPGKGSVEAELRPYPCGCGRAAAAPQGQRTAAGSAHRRRASPRCGSGGAASGCLRAAASQTAARGHRSAPIPPCAACSRNPATAWGDGREPLSRRSAPFRSSPRVRGRGLNPSLFPTDSGYPARGAPHPMLPEVVNCLPHSRHFRGPSAM